MSDFDFDLFVIGGGSGGVRAARTSAATGARVALAEVSRLGGTCVIRGCVPKKLMVFASEFRRHAGLAMDYGWNCGCDDFDWPRFKDRLSGELTRLEGVYRGLLTSSGVDIFDDRARITGPNEVEVAGKRYGAKHILVATGGHPVRPEMPGAEYGLVSDDVFNLDHLPKSVLIVGGGYIACEFACILNGLGVEVTQYYRGAQILRGFDDEARGLVAEAMRERGIDLHMGTNIVELAPAGEGEHGPVPTASDAAMGAPASEGQHASSADAFQPVPPTAARDPQPMWVKASNGNIGTFDRVMFATGRAPNTRGIGLNEVGVTLTRRGAIAVDAYSRTSVPSIWAIGDVTDRLQLTPVAIREGMAFTETVFRGNPTKPDHDCVPTAIFTQPEMGTVGLTEEAARDQEEIEVYCTSFRPMRTAFAGRSDRVLMKLIVSKATRRVLGCHIVAEGAGELIQAIGIAVKNGLTKEDFDRTVAVHPTISEELVTMSQPVRSA